MTSLAISGRNRYKTVKNPTATLYTAFPLAPPIGGPLFGQNTAWSFRLLPQVPSVGVVVRPSQSERLEYLKKGLP